MRTLSVLFFILILTLVFSFACSPSNGGTPSGNGGTNAAQGTQPGDVNANTGSGVQPEVPTNENATPQIGDPSTFSGDVQTDLPDGWRQDVPLLNGFVIDTFRKQGDGMMAICHGSLNIDSVTTYYSDLEGWQKNETPAQPWILEGSSRRLRYVRDNWSLLINLNEQAGVLSMTILVVETAA